MNNVNLHSSFEEILGDSKEVFTEDERRVQWDEWLKIAPKDAKDYWTDVSDCAGCIHLNGYWCSSFGLPCTVNPILSFRQGIIGMACMGSGKELRQEDLFNVAP